ncbi:hypothetical protein [Neorhizobium sp. DAR64861/K0K2]|uniref:hypothetical protein n=1 Tax=unclassified Neorhizobium TaxID=2629175 RepID=UPI003D279B8B
MTENKTTPSPEPHTTTASSNSWHSACANILWAKSETYQLYFQIKEFAEAIERGEVYPVGETAAVRPSPEKHMSVVGAALADALSERQRQLDAEGWIPQHDDQYLDNELIRAATCYLLGNAGNWPWSRNWWKPTDRRRDLIKAAALIIAEIERLDRAKQMEQA